jgi:hypothetical protein
MGATRVHQEGGRAAQGQNLWKERDRSSLAAEAGALAKADRRLLRNESDASASAPPSTGTPSLPLPAHMERGREVDTGSRQVRLLSRKLLRCACAQIRRHCGTRRCDAWQTRDKSSPRRVRAPLFARVPRRYSGRSVQSGCLRGRGQRRSVSARQVRSGPHRNQHHTDRDAPAVQGRHFKVAIVSVSANRLAVSARRPPSPPFGQTLSAAGPDIVGALGRVPEALQGLS